jgi:addiction module HigA family antidote
VTQIESDGASTVGAYIRQHVIPDGMSVKEAAKRLGVGRPALSNLLNSNAALSQDMAVRLEKALGADPG